MAAVFLVNYGVRISNYYYFHGLSLQHTLLQTTNITQENKEEEKKKKEEEEKKTYYMY